MGRPKVTFDTSAEKGNVNANIKQQMQDERAYSTDTMQGKTSSQLE